MSLSEPTPAARPVDGVPNTAPAAAAPPASVERGRAGSTLALMLALLGLAAAGAAAWQAWQTRQHVQELEQALVKRQQDTQGEVAEAKLVARAAQDLARESAAKVALTDARVAEIAAQRVQFEQLLQSLSRSRDENLIADLDAALRMARQQAAFTGSGEPLVATLRSADDRLARLAQPRFEPLRQAIARDLGQLREQSAPDLATLGDRLAQAAVLADRLPLRNDPPDMGPAVAQAAASAPTPGPRRFADWMAPLWEELRSLVRVSRSTQPDAMLLAPEQAWTLRENLKLRLMHARLAVSARQVPTLKADLAAARQAFQTYFDPAPRSSVEFAALLQGVEAAADHLEVPEADHALAWLQSVTTPGR